MQMVVAVKDDRLSLNIVKGDICNMGNSLQKKETQLSQTDTQRQDARFDARQDERQLPFAVTLAGRSDWHAACDNDAKLCACAPRVAASHVARLTELYGNIRSSAPIFRISDFKDFKISP